MSAIRYSGSVRLRLTYKDADPSARYADGTPIDPNGAYAVVLSKLDASGKVVARSKDTVGAPAALRWAVDSAEAFDDAARAALAFAYDADPETWGDCTDTDENGFHVSRSGNGR